MRLGVSSAAVAVLLAACSAGSTGAARPSPTDSPAPSSVPSSPAPICPNQETGGSCIGVLSGGLHSTEAFAAAFSYTAPARWSNEEDINGRYLLLPPGATRSAADDGSGDYLGVYTPVQGAARDCSDGDQPGVGTTPAAIATELARRPGLSITAAKPVTLGTLRGLVLDLRLAAGWTKSCPDGDPPFPLVPTISGGYRPEIISHAVARTCAVRLYLLTAASGTVAVELQDASGGPRLAALDAVARTIVFA